MRLLDLIARAPAFCAGAASVSPAVAAVGRNASIKHSVRSKLMILCAIVIGMYMFGLLGAIIAIPIAGCIRVLIDEYPNIKVANRQS